MSTDPTQDASIPLTQPKCPACGAPIEIPNGATSVTCGYCGSPIRVGSPARPERTGIEPDGTIRDKATGMGLFKVTVPDEWSCVSESVTQTATTSQPLLPKAILQGPDGAMVEIALGEAGDRLDGATKALMAMGGQHLAGIDRTNYAEMPDPIAFEWQLAETKAKEAGLTIRKANGYEQPPIDRLEGVRQAVMQSSRATTQQTGGLFVEDAMCCEVIRTYDAEADGKPWGMATAVRLVATRYSLGGRGSQLGGMMDGFGGMLRSIFGGGTPLPRTGGEGGVPPRQPQGQQGQQPPQQQVPQQGSGTLRSAGSFIMGGGLIGKMMRERSGQPTPQQQVPPQGAFGGFGGFAPQGQQGTSPYPTGRQVPTEDLSSDDFTDWAPPVTDARQDASQRQEAPQTSTSREEQAASASLAPPVDQPTSREDGTGQPQGDRVAWSVPDLAQFDRGNVSWEISIMTVMIAPKESFDREYERTFLPMLGATGVHPDVKSYKRRALIEQQGRNQQATNTAILQNQQMTQATLAAARERSTAFQSYNDAWSARSDAQHAAFRAASNARFAGSPSGGGAADFSEAIRGVNTFVTSDGREVELSVASDVAYENKAGDVVGGSTGFDPGADWNQIPRR